MRSPRKFFVRIEVISGDGKAVEYEPPRRAWHVAASLVARLGADGALTELDRRAELALFAGRLVAARTWRDLMVAVHRMTRDEPLRGESRH